MSWKKLITSARNASLNSLTTTGNISASGNIFATGPGGVLIFSPSGKHLGTIQTEVSTSNCAFDSDENYLYMTSWSKFTFFGWISITNK